MGMVLNTNIPSIQAQRALGESRKEMEIAMERLSTGSRINSAGDDAAGLAIVERMNTQILGLGQATRNANDGIALIKTVENALVEVTGMLQRMRELAVQSASDTYTATERAFADNEVASLQLEISRVSLNTRFNGAQVLNGILFRQVIAGWNRSRRDNRFFDRQHRIITTRCLCYKMGSPLRRLLVAQRQLIQPMLQSTPTILLSPLLALHERSTSKITIQQKRWQESQRSGSVHSGHRSAATFAIFSTATASTSNFRSIKINGTETASFTMTSNNVSDAVQKINAISSTTGVQASAVNNKILLKDADGDDIVLINTSARTDLKVQAVGIDGETVGGSELTFTAAGTNTDTANIRGNVKLTSNLDFKITQANATSFFTSGDTSAPVVEVSLP